MKKIVEAPDVEFASTNNLPDYWLTKEEIEQKMQKELEESRTDYLSLKNINCTDAQGNVFEHYNTLLVRKKNQPLSQSDPKTLTQYMATHYLEEKGVFLPSMALSCNIIAALYQDKNEDEKRQVLTQYCGQFNQQQQNTLVNWRNNQIIHYPNKEDYPEDMSFDINSQKQRMQFEFDIIEGPTFGRLIKDPQSRDFIKNLTGLQQPEILTEIGAYLGKPVICWTNTDWIATAAVTISLNSNYFSISAIEDLRLGEEYTERGVRELK